MINKINYTLTTHCNMSCPDCCAGITGMEKVKRQFHSWEYIEDSAKYFQGMEIQMTGGEPAIHPQFIEFAPRFKKLFNTPILGIWTNGTMFKKKPEAFKYFDVINVSHYTKDSFEGSPDNTEQIEFIKDYLKGSEVRLNVAEIKHYQNNEKTGMCERATIYSNMVEFVDGFVYPCSSSSGLPTEVKTELSKGWEARINQMRPPCHECMFAK